MKNNEKETNKQILVAVDKKKWSILKKITSLEEKTIYSKIDDLIDQHNKEYIKKTGMKF